ncbi:unnamed protein product [Linum tenue]|uniref:Uncharacterized protein n=1 Tax=Linum tenue TaxID=586396 RepID=A0AAV0HVT8_9ROSI|nr:unnamed protein product [Linum tenue]
MLAAILVLLVVDRWLFKFRRIDHQHLHLYDVLCNHCPVYDFDAFAK